MTSTDGAATGVTIARTAVGEEERASDALLRAARRAHVELDDGRRLQDQLDADALDDMLAHRRGSDVGDDCLVLVSLWERTFAITPDAVEVYP